MVSVTIAQLLLENQSNHKEMKGILYSNKRSLWTLKFEFHIILLAWNIILCFLAKNKM